MCRALIEVQPLLVDLSAAAAGGDSSSTSSSDEDTPGTNLASVSGPVDVPAGTGLQESELQQHGIRVDEAKPVNSTWRRVLLQLQRANSSSGTTGRELYLAQAAAVGMWLAGLAAQGATASAAGAADGAGSERLQLQPAARVVSLRCWYEADVINSLDIDKDWAQTLFQGLPSKLAGQLVPVATVHTSVCQMETLWCVIEVLLDL
jgi:hypothetical protein